MNRRSFLNRLAVGVALAMLPFTREPQVEKVETYTMTFTSTPVYAKITRLKGKWAEVHEQQLESYYGL